VAKLQLISLTSKKVGWKKSFSGHFFGRPMGKELFELERNGLSVGIEALGYTLINKERVIYAGRQLEARKRKAADRLAS
jgi:hypothetical protein